MAGFKSVNAFGAVGEVVEVAVHHSKGEGAIWENGVKTDKTFPQETFWGSISVDCGESGTHTFSIRISDKKNFSGKEDKRYKSFVTFMSKVNPRIDTRGGKDGAVVVMHNPDAPVSVVNVKGSIEDSMFWSKAKNKMTEGNNWSVSFISSVNAERENWGCSADIVCYNNRPPVPKTDIDGNELGGWTVELVASPSWGNKYFYLWGNYKDKFVEIENETIANVLAEDKGCRRMKFNLVSTHVGGGVADVVEEDDDDIIGDTKTKVNVGYSSGGYDVEKLVLVSTTRSKIEPIVDLDADGEEYIVNESEVMRPKDIKDAIDARKIRYEELEKRGKSGGNATPKAKKPVAVNEDEDF